MYRKVCRYVIYLILALSSIVGLLLTAPPSQAHWADMSAAEILVEAAAVRINLTYPTGLTSFADQDQNGQLSSSEIQTHRSELEKFFGEAIRLHNSENQAGELSLQPGSLSPGQTAPNSHSTVQLLYSWSQPARGLKIHYNLFLPGVATASCLATILQNHQLQTFVFTPNRQVLALSASSQAGLLLALSGALVWGALHSLSPGHGKTLVGAYLVGSRATPRHALFLALITTATHTVGIFGLGLVTLVASRYILPEQLYPWMNLLSGFLVVGIGCNLLRIRLSRRSGYHHDHKHKHTHSDHAHTHPDHLQFGYAYSGDSISGHSRSDDSHSSHRHYHDSDHHDKNHHSIDHYHGDHHDSNHHDGAHHRSDHHSHSRSESHHPSHHGHTHLPPEGPLTWRSLLLLGVSGGLVPCPAALVLLLSCIALGQVGLGLLLVGAFSLGLAIVLTGLGLMLVYAQQAFDAPVAHRAAQFLPKPASRLIQKWGGRALSIVSALGITAIGIGLVSQAVLQIV